MNIDTLIIKYKDDVDFIEDDVYEINIDYHKCIQILSLDRGVLQGDCDEFLKSIHGKLVPIIYKGKSRVDDINIFLLSPLQINRQIKLNQIL